MNGKRNCTGGCAGQEAADLNPPINFLILMEVIKFQLDLISKYTVKNPNERFTFLFTGTNFFKNSYFFIYIIGLLLTRNLPSITAGEEYEVEMFSFVIQRQSKTLDWKKKLSLQTKSTWKDIDICL